MVYKLCFFQISEVHVGGGKKLPNITVEWKAIGLGYVALEVSCRNFGGVFHNGIMVLEMLGAKRVIDHHLFYVL